MLLKYKTLQNEKEQKVTRERVEFSIIAEYFISYIHFLQRERNEENEREARELLFCEKVIFFVGLIRR